MEQSLKTNSELDRNYELRMLTRDLSFGNNENYHALVAMNRQSLSRVLYYDHLYQKIINVPGVICEFGVQWGASMVQLMNLRGIYEPYNFSRKIIGFDTFSGHAEVRAKDGMRPKVGDYSTCVGYESTLWSMLNLHEASSPLPHIRKFELVKGDASKTISPWLKSNPHTVISMAIFDMDVYAPTKNVLREILPRLVKGSLLVFDELNCEHFPGETRALNDVIGLNRLSLRRHPHQPHCAWAVYDGEPYQTPT